jgi:hypothetical protein
LKAKKGGFQAIWRIFGLKLQIQFNPFVCFYGGTMLIEPTPSLKVFTIVAI